MKLKRTILIVEDTQINRIIMKEILDKEYKIIEAENGEIALKILKEKLEIISAILLDLEMPVKNGFETLSEIHQNKDFAQIPVIITTGNTDLSSEELALSLGANDYITKPYNAFIIRQRIRNTINLRERSIAINALQKDKLTNLYNRETFFEKVQAMVSSHEPNYYIMSCLDIDNFKVINDQYGGDIGNEVLKHVASCIHSLDSEHGGICCRIMADKFAIVYPAFLMETPLLSENHQLIMRPSCIDKPINIRIGRYLVNDLSLSVSAMYDRATLAGESIRGRFDVFIAQYDESMRDNLIREQKIKTKMDASLKNGEFEPWFQPQYNHGTGALIGSEALVRWRDSEEGLISPSVFIPLFERNGFIYELDKYIWEQVCILIRKWLDQKIDVVPVSVNVSRCDILKIDFFDTIIGLVEKYNIPVDLLRLEVTESAFADASDLIIEMVSRLMDYGFIIEIDDFGSGYSSLNTLKDVPANILKLDMRFLESKGNLQRSGNILESVIRMAKWLGMIVIAEGVEKKEQADYLKSIGCSYIQGYLYSKPIPLAEYEKLIQSNIKESKLSSLETVDNLDNNAFWNPESMDTLIFNSYIGGACIFEYHNGKIEILRVNDKYAKVIGNEEMTIEKALKLNWAEYLDEGSLDRLISSISMSIATKDEVTEEFVFVNLPGTTKKTYLRSTIRVIASSGDYYLIYCTNENTTTQKETEQKEREANEQLEVIMKNINGGVAATVVKDNKSCLLLANDQYYKQLGYTKEEYEKIADPNLATIHPEDIDRVLKEAATISETKKSGMIIYRIIRKDKTIRWIQSNISIINFSDISDPVQLSVTNDITEQKGAEAAERKHLEQIQSIMESIGNGVIASILVDNKIKFLFSNDKYYEILGYTRTQYDEEVDDVFNLIYEEDRDRIKAIAIEAYESKRVVNAKYRTIRRDGQICWVRASLSTTNFADVLDSVQLCVFTDITQEKRSEEELRGTDEQIRFLNDNAHRLLAQPDTNKGIEDVLWELLNYFAGSRVYVFEFDFSKNISNNTYEVCAENVSSEINNLQNVPIHTMDFWIRTFDKQNYVSIENVNDLDESRREEREVLSAQNITSILAVPLRRDGHLIGFLGVDDPKQKQGSINRFLAIGDYISVILTRRDLDAKIINDNQTLYSLINDIPGGFVRLKIGENGSIVPVYVNNGFCKLVGMDNEEIWNLYGDDSFAGVHNDDIEIVRESIDEMIKNGEGFSPRYRLRYGKGGYVSVMIFGRLTADDIGEKYLNIYYIDVSKQVLLEEDRKELLDNLPLGAALYEYDGKKFRIIHINKRYKELVNREVEDDSELDFASTMDKNDTEKIFNELKLAIKEKRDAEVTCRIRCGEEFEYRIFKITARIIEKTKGKYSIYTSYIPLMKENISYQDMIPEALKAVMESSDDISFVKDINHSYVCCSKSYLKLLNLNDESEIVGKTNFDLIDEEIADKYLKIEEEIIKTGIPRINYDEILVFGNGIKKNVCTSKYPLYDADKKIIGIYSTSRDVTEIRTAFERLKMLTDTILGGISSFEVTKDAMRQIYVNEGFYNFSGYTKEEYLERSIKDPFFLVYKDDVEIVRKAIKSVKYSGDKIMSCVYRCLTKDGEYRWFDLKGIVSESHGESYILNIVQFDVTEEKQAMEKLRMSEEQFKIAASLGERTIGIYDIKKGIYYNDSELLYKHGFKNEIKNVPQAFIDKGLIAKESINPFREVYDKIKKGERYVKSSISLKNQNDEFRWYTIEATTLLDAQGKLDEAIIVYYDITDEREKEAVFVKWQQSLKERDPQSYTLFRSNLSRNDPSYDSIEGSLLAYEFEANEHTTFNMRTLKYAEKNVYFEDKDEYIKTLNSDLLLANYYRGKRNDVFEYREVKNDGQIKWYRITVELVEYPNSTDVLAFLMYEDIDDIKKRELETKAQAESDPLTGVFNRSTFMNLIEEKIKNANEKSRHVLMMMDIDGFKLVNDVFGHVIGDEVLVNVAKSIGLSLHHGDLIGRLGGDEFLIFMSDVPNDEEALKRAQELCSLVNKSLSHDVQISASIGLVSIPRDGDDFETLYKKADTALYYVKGTGKNNFAFYQEKMNDANFEQDKPINTKKEKKRQMLIVSDNQIDYELLVNIFKDDFIIHKANDGASALTMLRHYGNAISVVLLDISMTNVDGYKVLEKIQSGVEMQNIPVVIVSGDDNNECSDKVFKMGASDFASKHVNPDILKLRVYSAISKSEIKKLRNMNSKLEEQSTQVVKYQAIFEQNKTTIIEYEVHRGEFKYDLSISKYIAGTWDNRSLLKILKEDNLADSKTIKEIKDFLHMSAKKDDLSDLSLTVSLKAINNEMHWFKINIYKLTNENKSITKIILTLNDFGLERPN